MRLDDVMNTIRPVVGRTSLIGAPDSVDPIGASPGTLTLEGAREKLAAVKEAQDSARSDAAYWGYEGQRAYWACVESLLEAAEITGPDNLPDVPIPDVSAHVVMDAAFHLENFGAEVLKRARA